MKKYLGFICLIYSLIIIYVWSNDILKNFLAPQMQIYLKISLLFLIIIGLVLLFSKINYKFKASDLFLLLPLLMLVLAGDGRLTASLAQNRTNNFNKENINISKNDDKEENETKEEKINNDEKAQTPKYDFSKVDFNVIDESYYDLANYFTFIPSANKYVGKTIRVRGFTMLKDAYIPNGYFTIGKYNIACCAADAIYVGFYVNKEDYEIKDNTWYEIEGVIEDAVDTEGMETTAIKIINIKEIDSKKEEQYVYPCYAYDNGSCKEISKYDISY